MEFEYNKKKNCTLRYIAAAPTTAAKRVGHTLIAARALDEGGGARSHDVSAPDASSPAAFVS